ncbi:unnamed protein product [Darwinula stevensoni]|uniref:START domain-containing protein n=1 Tax=Darwinula stevensoni TaxID=69355 RepID=A0A7R9A053_9CRUS|nr:unnamed protein product [Darwinula stevensoni]CAG0883902.1 unnamed protein product [Darwinula stevensoni]
MSPRTARRPSKGISPGHPMDSHGKLKGSLTATSFQMTATNLVTNFFFNYFLLANNYFFLEHNVGPDLIPYVEQGEETLDTLQEIMKLKGWQKMNAFTNEGFNVKKLYHPGMKRTMFLIQAIVDLPYEELFEEVWFNGENIPEWNPNVANFTEIKRIGDRCRVTYQVTSPQAGGAIGPRDFLNLICCRRDGNTIYSGYISSSWPGYEVTDEYVRGEVYPSGFAYSPAPEDPMKTQVLWLYNTDLRLSFMPEYILNNILPVSFRGYILYFQEHLTKVRRSRTTTTDSMSMEHQ